MKNQLVIILFVSSSIGATIVNKYVLSILRFTYPSVFQSWQMTVAFSAMYALFSIGYIQLPSIERLAIIQWFPAMCSFTLGIYSGSVALSRLPIPIFFTSYHFVYVACSILDNFIFKKVPTLSSLFGLALGLVGLFSSISNFPVINGCLYIACLQCHTGPLQKESTKANYDLEKTILNSSFSILLLLPIGIFSGEIKKCFEFPYLHNRDFYHGFVTSGICGALVGLSYCKLASQMSVSKLRWIVSLTTVLASIISFAVFPFKASILVTASITTTLTGSVIYTYSASNEELQNEKTGERNDSVQLPEV